MFRYVLSSWYRIGGFFLFACALMLEPARVLAQSSPAQSGKAPPQAPSPVRKVAGKPPRPRKPAVIDRSHDILRADHAQLFRGRLEFKNVGANIPDLFERFLSGDDSGAEKMLADAEAAGVRFVRCFGTTWGPEKFGLFETDRLRWLGAFDRMLAAGDRHGIAIVPSLLFNIRMLPDYVQRKTGVQEGLVGYLTPGTNSNRLAVAYVTAIVFRYRADPRVLFWEIGNEYNLEADLSMQWKARPAAEAPSSEQIRSFLVQIGSVIKRIDRKHLVTSGNSDNRPAAWHMREAMRLHRTAAAPMNYPMDWTRDTLPQYMEMIAYLNPAPLDLISVHQYAPDPARPDDTSVSWLMADNSHAVLVSWARVAAQSLDMPLFVGEFGEPFVQSGRELSALWTQDFLVRMPLGTAPISAVWAWEYAPDGQPTPNTLSPTATPSLIALLATTNRTILNDIIGASPIVAPAPK